MLQWAIIWAAFIVPKDFRLQCGITKPEIQPVFSGLWGSRAMGVFVIFSSHWSRSKAPGDARVSSIVWLAAGINQWTKQPVTEHWGPSWTRLGGRASRVSVSSEPGQKGRDWASGCDSCRWKHSVCCLCLESGPSQTCFLSLSQHSISLLSSAWLLHRPAEEKPKETLGSQSTVRPWTWSFLLHKGILFCTLKAEIRKGPFWDIKVALPTDHSVWVHHVFVFVYLGLFLFWFHFIILSGKRCMP